MMLGWLFPRPPVSACEKAWIEYRTAWLIETLGARRILDAKVILPDDDFFPDDYQLDAATAEAFYVRVCKFLQVDPSEMRFEVVSEDDIPGAAGHYDATDPNERPALRISGSQMHDPESLVATLAHEVAHHILLGGGHMSGEEEDHELVTDLLPCVFGLGIFTANSTIRFQSHTSGTWHSWEMKRRGYLPSHRIGYALAMFAWLRDERQPDWRRHLRLDARETMDKGLRYLRRTGDCYLTREYLGASNKPTLAELATRLRLGKPAARIQALWDVGKHEQGDSQAAEIRRLTRHGNANVREAAIDTVAALQLIDLDSLHEVVHALRDGDEKVRAAAAGALGILRATGTLATEDQAVFELGQALTDEARDIVFAAAYALKQFGTHAATEEKQFMKALHAAFIECDYPLIDTLLDNLRIAVPDAGQSINDYFADHDGEYRQAAIDALYNSADPEIMYDDPPAQ